jgi:hypothetical protein
MREIQGFILSIFCFLFFTGMSYGADAAFGKSVIVKPGTTVDSAVSFGNEVQVYGTVTDAAVSFGSDVVVESGGKILGDAVSLGGDIRVKDNASVGRDAVSLGGIVDVAPAGIVSGKVVKIDEKWTGFHRGWNKSWTGEHNYSNSWNHIPLFQGASLLRTIFLGPLLGIGGLLGTFLFIFFFFMRLFLWLCVAILAVIFFPENVNRLSQLTSRAFGISFLLGLVMMIALPFFFLFMLVTIIGIPFIPLAAACFFLVYIFGTVGVALWFGKLFPNSASRSQMRNTMIGVLAISMLRLIPGIGFVVWILLVSVSLGSIILSRLGTQQYTA